MFYNTLNLEGATLFDSEQKSVNQESIVLRIFRDERKDLTPFEVQKKLYEMDRHYPITSIRRAITDLTKDGKLRKTTVKRKGEYGQDNYAWELNNV